MDLGSLKQVENSKDLATGKGVTSDNSSRQHYSFVVPRPGPEVCVEPARQAKET